MVSANFDKTATYKVVMTYNRANRTAEVILPNGEHAVIGDISDPANNRVPDAVNTRIRNMGWTNTTITNIVRYGQASS